MRVQRTRQRTPRLAVGTSALEQGARRLLFAQQHSDTRLGSNALRPQEVIEGCQTTNLIQEKLMRCRAGGCKMMGCGGSICRLLQAKAALSRVGSSKAVDCFMEKAPT